MLLTALTSIIDSQITSVATLISHDVVPQFSEKVAESRSIDISRVAVMAVVALSWALVNIPGVNILYFGLLAGCICMTFFVPTLISLFRPAWIRAQSMVAGILVALTVGFPVYAYASLNKMVELSLVGFFTCLIASATITLVGSYLQRKMQ
jgi:Na+/proline symporter